MMSGLVQLSRWVAKLVKSLFSRQCMMSRLVQLSPPPERRKFRRRANNPRILRECGGVGQDGARGPLFRLSI